MASSQQFDRNRLFGYLADPETRGAFFEHVADDVQWKVMGTHPLAGTYTSKDDFLAKTFGRLDPLMRNEVRLAIVGVHLAADFAIAELRATCTAIDGKPYDNTYCWVCRFDGESIVEVRAYLDSALVSDLIARTERALQGGPTSG